MAITMFVPGFKTSRSDERHGDGLVIHSDTGHTLVIDGFDGGAPTTALVKYLKQHNYKDLHLLLSHPHYDHYKGLKVIMADSFFNKRSSATIRRRSSMALAAARMAGLLRTTSIT